MIVITGASDGLGAELAKQLTKTGKKVICLSRTKPNDLNIEWMQLDIQDPDSISSACEILLSKEDNIEALINSAAIVSYEAMNKLSPKALDDMFKTNVTGPMLLISGLLDRMKKDRSDIINIGATIALKAGGPDQSTYSTVKWAMRGFTENLQKELKSTQCRVINFLVGGFQSRLHEKVTGEQLDKPEEWMPVEDVAYCLVQLLQMPKSMEISEIVVNRKTNV